MYEERVLREREREVLTTHAFSSRGGEPCAESVTHDARRLPSQRTHAPPHPYEDIRERACLLACVRFAHFFPAQTGDIHQPQHER